MAVAAFICTGFDGFVAIGAKKGLFGRFERFGRAATRTNDLVFHQYYLAFGAEFRGTVGTLSFGGIEVVSTGWACGNAYQPIACQERLDDAGALAL